MKKQNRDHQRVFLGKGEALACETLRKIFCIFLCASFIFSFCVPNSFARDSGGGKLAKFDVGKWAAGQAIGLGSFAVGSVIGSGISGAFSTAPNASFASGISSGISNLGNVSQWAANYSVMAGASQVARAVNTAGRYYGWDPSVTIIASSVASGAAAGGINPSSYGVTGPLYGASMGAFEGAVSGGVEAALAKDGKVEPWMGLVGGLAGGMATGFVYGTFSQGDTRMYTDESGRSFIANTQHFSLGNKPDFGRGLSTAVQGAITSLPSRAIRMGVDYLAQNSSDYQDRAMIQNAFSGIYPIVGATVQGITEQLSSKVKEERYDPKSSKFYIEWNKSAATTQPAAATQPAASQVHAIDNEQMVGGVDLSTDKVQFQEATGATKANMNTIKTRIDAAFAAERAKGNNPTSVTIDDPERPGQKLMAVAMPMGSERGISTSQPATQPAENLRPGVIQKWENSDKVKIYDTNKASPSLFDASSRVADVSSPFSTKDSAILSGFGTEPMTTSTGQTVYVPYKSYERQRDVPSSQPTSAPASATSRPAVDSSTSSGFSLPRNPISLGNTDPVSAGAASFGSTPRIELQSTTPSFMLPSGPAFSPADFSSKSFGLSPNSHATTTQPSASFDTMNFNLNLNNQERH